MLPLGAWLDHPQFGRGRVTGHNDTRYICTFPGIGLREFDSHEAGVKPAPTPPQGDPLKTALREVLDEYGFGGASEILPRFEGGEIVVRPSKEGTKEIHLPVDALFHKVVMVRDRLRVLEQKINAHPKLTDLEKVEMQQYVTRCYGSLTSFNVLFKREEDKFRGSGS